LRKSLTCSSCRTKWYILHAELGPYALTHLPPRQYDCLVYDGNEHVRIATLPGMWERTVTVGSAGSTYPHRGVWKHASAYLSFAHAEAFAATGWRVGWLIGPESIITPSLAACTRIVFCSASPMQEAVAGGLELAKQHNFFEVQTREYEERRDVLIEAFKQLGVRYVVPQGSYFILIVSKLFSDPC
jgi:kynurenine aminotransferase